MTTHDTIIRVQHRPNWQQRVPFPIDDPEVDLRMRAIAWHWLHHTDVPLESVRVWAIYKGFSREFTASRDVRYE